MRAAYGAGQQCRVLRRRRARMAALVLLRLGLTSDRTRTWPRELSKLPDFRLSAGTVDERNTDRIVSVEWLPRALALALAVGARQ